MRIRESIQDPYSIRHCEQMDTFEEGLWAHPERIVELSPDTARQVIAYLLGSTCQATNDAPIMLGRRALYTMPRTWLVERIEQVASDVIDLQDEWEYRRLLELYCCLDDDLAQSLASQGLSSSNSEVQETAQDYLGNPKGFKANVCVELDQSLP